MEVKQRIEYLLRQRAKSPDSAAAESSPPDADVNLSV
jgi:hypothetical protein